MESYPSAGPMAMGDVQKEQPSKKEWQMVIGKKKKENKGEPNSSEIIVKETPYDSKIWEEAHLKEDLHWEKFDVKK